MDQLKTIFRALGTPTEEEWPVRFYLFLFPLPQDFFLVLFSRAFRNFELLLFINFLIVPF